MKFLCVPCDEQMETQKEGLLMTDDSKNIALKFKCKKCGHTIAMLTNKFETEFVSKLGVEAGGASEFGKMPFGMVGSSLAGGKEELKKSEPTDEADVEWTQEAKDRIQKVPFFVRGMAKKTVINFAKSKGIKVIDAALMDEVRDKVGM
ncbi:PCP reductase family protein [Nitrospina watsonii]|uniref:PCP_red domain-containing protein n=1 Tax=Nitrospina watsonii TaxID=1323948 RepID=A0ABM9HDP8_9BACT|nr:PCP reductase family protein [Nitrospina watsonii]CAI2718205.1 PCP_red domain-containing protein [Nitrospina watsonii]